VIVAWATVLVVGLAGAAWASRHAVLHAVRASEKAGVSAGLVGVTVLAIGTDLPEIAASIVAALSGDGDIIVGDAAGSAYTQVTLVLGLLCIATVITADRASIAMLGALTVLALVVVGWLVSDGVFSRTDGLLMVSGWVLAVVATFYVSPPSDRGSPRGSTRALPDVGRALGWLAIVAVCSTAVVESFVRVTESIGVPQLVASAVVLSLGTSLPELVVDLTALRRGAVALALGDLFGSSLLDASLAIGIGPSIRATAVSPEAATACMVAAAGVAAATVVVVARREHRYGSAIAFFLVYGATTATLIVMTG